MEKHNREIELDQKYKKANSKMCFGSWCYEQAIEDFTDVLRNTNISNEQLSWAIEQVRSR